MCVQVCVCRCACGDQRLMSGISNSLLYFFRQELLPNLHLSNLARLANQRVPGLCLSGSPFRIAITYLVLSMSAGDLNLFLYGKNSTKHLGGPHKDIFIQVHIEPISLPFIPSFSPPSSSVILILLASSTPTFMSYIYAPFNVSTTERQHTKLVIFPVKGVVAFMVGLFTCNKFHK